MFFVKKSPPKKSMSLADCGSSTISHLMFLANLDVSGADPKNVLIPVQRERIVREMRALLSFEGFLFLVEQYRKNKITSLSGVSEQEAGSAIGKALWLNLPFALSESGMSPGLIDQEIEFLKASFLEYLNDVEKLKMASKGKDSDFDYAHYVFAERATLPNQDPSIKTMIFLIAKQVLDRVQSDQEEMLDHYTLI